MKEQPENTDLGRLQRQLTHKSRCQSVVKMPRFLAKDINGKVVNNSTFQGKDIVIINTWAAWSYESLGQFSVR